MVLTSKRAVLIYALIFTFNVIPPAAAITWTVCNRTTDQISVVVAYGRDDTYVSKVWWRLAPCGGCARVANDVSVTGPYKSRDPRHRLR